MMSLQYTDVNKHLKILVLLNKKFTKGTGAVDRKDIKTINESKPNHEMRKVFLSKMEEID